MKKGFTNTDRAKRKLGAASDIPSDEPRVGKGKEKATEAPTDTTMPYPPMMDLHSIAPSMKSFMNYMKNKNRFIFRHWPRDPNGKPILPSDIHGKEAGNGLDLWGATLYDFYFVRRIPGNVHALTISSGSKLTKVMQAFGELGHAIDEIARAAHEVNPKEIPAWDPAHAIVAHERRVGSSIVVKMQFPPPQVSAVRRETDSQTIHTSDPIADQEPREDAGKALTEPVPDDSANKHSSQPANSEDNPFHPSHYPPPWPLPPFETSYSPSTLQQPIPIHLLPKKLYVHDPWHLVLVNPEKSLGGEKEFWASKTEHVHTYTLSLPPESQIIAEAASNAAAAAEDKSLVPPPSVFIPPRETAGPTEQPALRAFLPKRPRKLTEVPEAHLYLSPRGKLGRGHHSIVYEAELELPRDLYCDSTYCQRCFDKQIKVEVDKLKKSGEWERRMNEAAEAYKAPGQQDPSSHAPSSSSVQIPPRYVGFVKETLKYVPIETVDPAAATTSGEAPPADAPSHQFARVSDPVINRYLEYKGMIASIYPNVQWQNPSFPDTLCKHQTKKKKPVPRTARLRVAAKLSLPGDRHLAREANNYLKFPAHFFQHWTGYNVVPPLLDPTPIGALVPQFFGYYTPDASPGSGNNLGAYRSPILLMEHCGKPIRADELKIDDRHECASLLFRFHHAGWLHESFAERNILMQERQPTCNPLDEECRCGMHHQHRRYSFRLIDFGRSVEYKDPSSRSVEESDGKKLFKILCCAG